MQEPHRVARRGHRLPARTGPLRHGLGHVGGVQLGILGVVHPGPDGFLGQPHHRPDEGHERKAARSDDGLALEEGLRPLQLQIHLGLAGEVPAGLELAPGVQFNRHFEFRVQIRAQNRESLLTISVLGQ